MTRDQLVSLSGVNRRFYSVIQTSPLTMKPLFRAGWFDLHRDVYCVKELWRMTVNNCEFIGLSPTRIAVSDVADYLEPMIGQQWLRFHSEWNPSRKHSLG